MENLIFVQCMGKHDQYYNLPKNSRYWYFFLEFYAEMLLSMLCILIY